MNIQVDARLLDFCTTDRQTEIMQAVIEDGSLRGAARKLNCAYSNVAETYNRLRVKGAESGMLPNMDATRFVGPGQRIKGKSTYTKDDEGNPIWIKTTEDQAAREQALKDFIDGLADYAPRIPAKKAAKLDYDADLMPTIFIGDAHVGMRAYGKETKHHDFDTDIAVEQLREAADYLIDKAEPAEIGMVVDVGDFHHANGHNNTTFGGTQLDVDTRHRSTMYQGAMAMRYMIDRMLDKCKKVVVVVARGNHNDDVAPAMELMLSFAYENEPRVQVLETNGYYHYIEFGGNLLGICHGDKQKPEALAGSMARDMPVAWGRTNYRMWCTGHYHKEAVKSLPGCRHKIFGALPPPDGWHASHGFSGDGEMEMLTFRRAGGVQSSFVYRIARPTLEPDVRL